MRATVDGRKRFPNPRLAKIEPKQFISDGVF
jgi:hypothetical protein